MALTEQQPTLGEFGFAGDDNVVPFEVGTLDVRGRAALEEGGGNRLAQCRCAGYSITAPSSRRPALNAARCHHCRPGGFS
jgi:hypothetical protein